MRTRVKTIARSTAKESVALGVLFFVLSLFVAMQAWGAEEPASCRAIKTLEKRKQQQKMALDKAKEDVRTQPTMQTQVDILQGSIDSIQADIYRLDPECTDAKAEAQSKLESCHKKAEANPDLYDSSEDSCEIREVGSKANPNQGECSAAELLSGTNLKGEACKNAANAIKSVQAQQESVGAATTAAVQGYSSYQANMATGQQADAQNQQKKILQTLAVAKIATGALQLAGAAQLKSAAGNATTAASNISGAHQDLRAACDSPGVRRENLTDEQCFYKYGHNFGIPPEQKEYATFERLTIAQNQSQAQADRANEMAKSSMVSGMADAFVGIQAMMMARQTQQAATGMGAPPVAPPIMGYNIGGASRGGLAPGGGAGPANPNSPTDFGDGSSLGSTLEGGGGPLSNGIKDGQGFAPTPGSKPERSTVSTSGGGGGGGSSGGGGRGSGSSRKGGGPSNTTTGEIQLGGSAGGFRGGNGPAEKGEGGNAFAEALAKLFPQDPNGKPVVETRQLASESNDMMEGAFAGSDVEAVDTSLFQQITAKYRQLSYNGAI